MIHEQQQISITKFYQHGILNCVYFLGGFWFVIQKAYFPPGKINSIFIASYFFLYATQI